MNRRNFFKAVTGFVAGVYALALPSKAKPQLTVAMLREVADKLPKQKAGKIFWMPVKDKAEEWTYVTASYNGKGNSDGIEIYPKRKLRIEAAEKAANPLCFIQWSYCEDKKCFTMSECSDNIHVNKDGSLSIV